MHPPDPRPIDLPSVLTAAIDLWNQQGKHFSIPVAGNSMLPLLREGDRVLLAPGYANVRRGDVIVFWQNERMLIHRVIRIYGDKTQPTFLTRGDNTRVFDAPIQAEKLIGKVVTIERASRQISLDTRAWRVWGYVIAVVESVGARLLEWGVRIKQRFWGTQPNRFTTLVRRILSAPLRVAFKILNALFVRQSQTSNDKHEQAD